MSCDGINCERAMEQLWGLIDRELAEADARQVREHLDVCQRCYPEYDFHRAYRDFIASRARHAAAPPALRRRIFMALLEEEGEGQGE
jgi:anti-sigma factor (TIGR02949 family)